MNSLDRLGPIADEMLAGLHADQKLKIQIREKVASRSGARRSAMPRALVPALCCAALAFMCVGALNLRGVSSVPQAAQISTIAAGDGMPAVRSVQMADLGDHAQVGAAVPGYTSLFAEGSGDIPLVAVDGAVYRMLTAPKALSSSLRGGAVGRVNSVTGEPSLASADDFVSGLSNVADEGAAVYSVKGLSSRTAVAAEVNGQMRLFQRVSYAGKGPGGQSLEDTLDVRGKVKTLELSGVGTLSGDSANLAIAVLLDNASLRSADASARKQSLTMTLDSGLKLQLGVSGDMLTGCGGWSCPEFFDAFEAAL